MRKPMREKADWELTIAERIERAGWFPGSEADWKKLPLEERADLSFAATGCAVAYPSWAAPVECVHTGCQLRRGEIKPLIVTNRILRYEMESGWLRFGKESREGRARLGRLIRAIRNWAVQTGEYDPWKIPGGWKGIVSAGIIS